MSYENLAEIISHEETCAVKDKSVAARAQRTMHFVYVWRQCDNAPPTIGA